MHVDRETFIVEANSMHFKIKPKLNQTQQNIMLDYDSTIMTAAILLLVRIEVWVCLGGNP